MHGELARLLMEKFFARKQILAVPAIPTHLARGWSNNKHAKRHLLESRSSNPILSLHQLL